MAPDQSLDGIRKTCRRIESAISTGVARTETVPYLEEQLLV
jgi:hypothetical protein